MRNFKNNRRRFRNNNFEKGLKLSSNDQSVNSALGNVADFRKKNFSRGNFNSPKLIQKYSDLAREALSHGDKILYENYMQHAEHFIRITENFNNHTNHKEKNQEATNQISLKEVREKDLKEETKLQVEEN